jgi:type IX secretion system PorP/SprF family membrane protein
MRKIITLLIFTLFLLQAKAQQNPLYTQFMFNPFVINPAITGTHSYYQVWLNSRLQWIGMNDAPLTNTLSIYGPLENYDMGVGGFVYSDVTGPTSRVGMNGSYAYNFAINEDYRLSAGLSLGFLQYKIDGTQIDFEVQEADGGIKEAFFLPDASIGVDFYNNLLHVGLSATQLFNNKIDVIESMDSAQVDNAFGRLKSHYYLTAGYKYFVNREIAIEPTLILRAVNPSTPQLDFNARVIYNNMVWGGISFRTNDAISIIGGYSHENKVFLGLSYDIGITDLAGSNAGTFEAIVGWVFDAIKF